MLLYYTGSAAPFQIQQDPGKSLGGYVSSSFIPNDVLGSLFSSVFIYEVEKNTPSTKLIALRNSFPTAATAVRIWTETPEDSLVTYKIGLAEAMVDQQGNLFFEYLQQEDSLPFYSTLGPHEGEENALTSVDLETGKYVGIWIRRELKELPENHPAIEVARQTGFDFNGDKLATALEAMKELEQKEETVKLIIDWV